MDTETPTHVFARSKGSLLLFYPSMLMGIFGGTFIFYILYKDLPEKFAHNDIAQIFTALTFGIFAAFALIYAGTALFLSRWRHAFIVELYEDRIIGYSMAGYNRWELKWDEIVAFAMPKFGGWHCSLVDVHGNEIKLPLYLAPFVECIETILSRIPHLERSDLARLKKERRFWDRNRTMAPFTDKEIQEFLRRFQREVKRRDKAKITLNH